MKHVSSLPTVPSLLISPDTPLIHRDLSWLQFNERVLAEAREPNNPLLERLKFLSITASNLDEFFTIRFASLIRIIQRHKRHENYEMIAQMERVRSSILKAAFDFNVKQIQTLNLLSQELKKHGIFLVQKLDQSEIARQVGKKILNEEILSQLSAPEEFNLKEVQTLANLQFALFISNNKWIKVPKNFPVVFLRKIQNNRVLVYFLTDLLLWHYSSERSDESTLGMIRLTRDGDIEVDFEDEDPESIPDIVRTKIRTRDKGQPVRLQCSDQVGKKWIKKIRKNLKLPADQIFSLNSTTCLHGLWAAINRFQREFKNRSQLFYPPLKPSILKPFFTDELSADDLFDLLKQRDWLLHHPYDSFDNFVALIQKACLDPKVVRIEMTIYRMDAVSPILEALKSAAKTKKIRLVIEPRARFDELNNLNLAEDLRSAGAIVAYGMGNLKLHAKVALITRKEGHTQRFYTHLSTGNYNATTARQYTDLAIISAHKSIGRDARRLFDAIFNRKLPTSFKVLVSAPENLHQKILFHIEKEISAAKKGKPAHLFAKVNALVDFQLITQLYRASKEGVKIDLVVRGACALIPGVPGLSENIRVISVIDRFLEHSRIYYFKNSHVIYLSSADWMQRNFFSRFEIAFPVLDSKIYRYLEEVVIPTYVNDTEKAWQLTPRGSWIKRSALNRKFPIRSQLYFEKLSRVPLRKESKRNLKKTT